MSDSMKIVEQLLRYSNERNKVLASNIANVDTPFYKTKDIAFPQVLGTEMSLATTDAKHLGGSGSAGTIGQPEPVESQSWGDKNNVEMDSEMAKMTENGLFFQAGVTLLEIQIRMYKNALLTR